MASIHQFANRSALDSQVGRSHPMLQCYRPTRGICGTCAGLVRDFFTFFPKLATHLSSSFMNVHAACRAKGLSFPSAMSKNLSFGVYIALCWLWVTSPHSSLLARSKDPVPSHGGLIEFTFLVVCTFGKMLPRVIIAHLTHSPFPALLPSVVLPVLGGALLVNLNRFEL